MDMTAKEAGKECIRTRDSDTDAMSKAMEGMAAALNSKPLVLIPIATKNDRDRMVLAFLVGEHEFIPIGIMEPSCDLKALIGKVYYHGDYKFHDQSILPEWKSYSEGELWG